MCWFKKVICRNDLIFIFLVFCLFAVFGCSKNYVQLTMFGKANQNAGGNAVVVRIYQLQNDANFQRATLQSFWQEERADEQVLGGELVKKLEILLHPEESRQQKIEISDETLFIGAAANFFSPDKDGWRQIIPVEKYRGKQVWFIIESNKIKITDPKTEKKKQASK
ncbi:type VI secretion system lipoprotein TssJ [candidate division CSSED10-310 bacterium]|uniref:Type VI secretion system lipoprotein TssJ n=1 Tax=candidate division CSSED10-310 bacterium TaxID=2855610 RepID=A0ABV6Z4R6_UNCC1